MCESSVYFFKGTFFKRDFKGQSSGPRIFDENIFGNTLEEVQDQVYDLSRENMQREVIFLLNGTDREIMWATNVRPEKQEVAKYIMFQDKSMKKVYYWTEITTTLLKAWRKKDIGILIHVHSLSLGCSADYEAAKGRLMVPTERDRAGAASIEVVNLMTKKLQETHIHLEGLPAAWKIWANYILSSNPGEQEDLIYRLPPTGISENLRIRMPNHPLLLSAQNRLNIAHNVNHGYGESISDLRHTFNALAEMLKIMDIKIKSLEDRFDMQEGLVSSMEQDLNLTESDHSQNLATRVTDAPDVDHF